eukprot:3109386-Alexandrium_andersonii.AAC.1
MGPAEVKGRLRRARERLGFVAKLYQSQLGRGARFLRERPASASSWKEPAVVELLSRPGVPSVVGHACRFGARVPR